MSDASEEIQHIHCHAWEAYCLKPEIALALAKEAQAHIATSARNSALPARRADWPQAPETDPLGPGKSEFSFDITSEGPEGFPNLLAENYALQAACAARAEEQGIALPAEPADSLIQTAEAHLTPAALPLLRARIHYVKASILRNQLDYASAESMLQSTLALLPDHDSPVTPTNLPQHRLRIDALNDIGRLQIFHGDFPEALKTGREILDRIQQIPPDLGGYPYGEAFALKKLAVVYQRLGNFVDATAAIHRSMAISEMQADHSNKISCLVDLAHISMCIDEPAEALDYLNAALEIASTHNFIVMKAVVLGNIGYVLYVRGDLDRAIEHYETAVEIQRNIPHLRGEAGSLCNLGDALEAQGRFPEAQARLGEALAIHRQLEDRYGIATTLISLGRLSAQTADPKGDTTPNDSPAFRCYLEEALEVIAQTGSQDLLVSAHEAYSNACKHVGDFAGALHHYILFHEGKEKMAATHAADRTQALLVKHQLEQSRKDAEVQRQHALELQAALNEAREQRALAERLANEDMLTGLPNRRYGDRLLVAALETAQNEGRPLSIVFADADHFKRINDSYSHLTGDRVLSQLAIICRQHCRSTDIAVRYGGEEILFILPHTDQEEAIEWSERLRIHVEQFDWATIHPAISVTLSLGVAACSSEGELVQRAPLLSLADKRLYEAKKAGRNCVRPQYTPSRSDEG